jgi:homoserine kinase type II
MGAFTVLGDADLAAIADAFELGPVRSWRAIAAGTINSNFALETPHGRTFVRVNEGKAEGDVAWEARLVDALAARGLATPGPLRARDGRPYLAFAGKYVSAFPWVDGAHVLAITAPVAEALGAQLALLHRIGLALPETWRRASIYDHDHLAARYRAFAGDRDPELAHAIALLGEELALAADAAPVRRAATHGLIHGDLFRDNVLWDGGRLVAILDFEQASGGSLAYDLAVCINDWCWDGSPRLDLARALLRGYGPLAPADREALPVEIRCAAARFTITRITDVYLANVVNSEKDFRAFLARVEAWRGPALGQLRAAL